MIKMSRLLLALAACVGVCSAMEEESPILRGGGAPRLPKEVKDDIHHFKHQDCGGVQKNCDRSLKFPMCCAKPGGFSYCSASSPYAHPADGRDPFNPCAPGFTRDAARMTSLPPGLRNCTLALKQTRLLGDFLPVFGVRPSKVAQAWRAMHAPSMVPSARADLSAW